MIDDNKIAWHALVKVLFGDRMNRLSIYDKMLTHHPIAEHWREVFKSDHSHDDQQDEIVLLLNEVLQSSEDSNE